jgi:hypothetical protein
MKSIHAFVVATSTTLFCLTSVQNAPASQETQIPRSTPRNPTVQSAPIQRTPVTPERQLGLPPSARGTIPPASGQGMLPPPIRIPAEPVRPLSTPSQRTEPRVPQLTPPQPLGAPMEPRPNVVPPGEFRGPPPVSPLQPARR